MSIGDAKGIDLNNASERDIARIGGIGPDKARRICQNRPFNGWDDLKKIDGLNQKFVNELRHAGATIGPKTQTAGGR
jgi:DNA uptake protein ComE-like DNA-binding protein